MTSARGPNYSVVRAWIGRASEYQKKPPDHFVDLDNMVCANPARFRHFLQRVVFSQNYLDILPMMCSNRIMRTGYKQLEKKLPDTLCPVGSSLYAKHVFSSAGQLFKDLRMECPEGAKLIPLTQGKSTIVDAEDFEELSQYNWHVSHYCRQAKSHKIESWRVMRRKGKTHVYMSREIMKPEDGMVVDHINHDTLDNRKANLRTCTSSENMRNSYPQKNASSPFKGVTPVHRKWKVHIRYKNTMMYLGLFSTEIDAALAYDRKAKELHGEFAYLNFK